MEKKPIKRNKHIVQLSRDHHFGLLFCWKIRQGLQKGVALERIRAYINYFWQQHLVQHFEEEENLLFGKISEDVVRQPKDEHQIIRLLITDINGCGKEDVSLYKQLVSLMDQHIRFEERVMFPYIEEHLSESQLQEIAGVLTQNHKESFKDEFSDEFWTKEK